MCCDIYEYILDKLRNGKSLLKHFREIKNAHIVEKTVINLQEFNTRYWNLKIVPSVRGRLMSYNAAYFFLAADDIRICAGVPGALRKINLLLSLPLCSSTFTTAQRHYKWPWSPDLFLPKSLLHHFYLECI